MEYPLFYAKHRKIGVELKKRICYNKEKEVIYMYEVLKYIQENVREDLNLSDVSEKFGYSKWHFCSKFHKYTKKTFTKYVRSFKLQLASIDILAGKRITDIALDYGYDSVGGFNKAFVAEFGCYPSEYKKNAKDALAYYERRKVSMYQLTGRLEILKNLVTNPNDYEDRYCVQHRVYTTVGRRLAADAGLGNPEIVSGGLTYTLDNFMPVIMPNELIVGFNFPDSKYPQGVKPQNNAEWADIIKKNGISDEIAERYFAIDATHPPKEAWQYYDLKYKNPEITALERDLQAELASIGNCTHSNHSVIGYELVLSLGFSGLLEKIEKYEKINGGSSFYSAAKAICRSAMKMGEKYAAEARRLLESGDSEYSNDDLLRIISVCENVPAHPAKTLHEAIQAIWFAHVLNTWEDGINANSVGRLDQILYPYYVSDIEKGIITKEEAFELIACLWLKLYLKYDVQQSCVGGTDENGNCAVNELSYMMLDATEQLEIIRCLSVRYSQKTDKEFLKRALEVVGHLHNGVPFFFNDDVMIPSLELRGISHKDASDYTQIGCVETVIPGKSNPHAVTGRNNLMKPLEYVFGNGQSLMYPEFKNGIETGELQSFDTFEKFYAAVLAQIRNMLDVCCKKIKKMAEYTVDKAPRPFKSILTEGCLENGRDFNGFGAKYDFYQIMLFGVPNLADSLEVIRKFVYTDKKYTLADIKEMLINDFPDESVRLELVNKAAKFGNDIDGVDMLASDIVDKCCDHLDEFSKKYGMEFHAQPFTFRWMLEYGAKSAASPDGRRKGEILAYSVSPMQGRDFSGLTALLNSIAKFPTKRTPGTTSAIVEIDPKLFTDRNITVLRDIFLAASEKGLNNVQFNTIDAETLIDAKKNPEKYNNLAVRVSGFSQKFNLLSPELQDHIIGRTKHSCL